MSLAVELHAFTCAWARQRQSHRTRYQPDSGRCLSLWAKRPRCSHWVDHRSTNSSGPINSCLSESAGVSDSRLNTSNASSPRDPTLS